MMKNTGKNIGKNTVKRKTAALVAALALFTAAAATTVSAESLPAVTAETAAVMETSCAENGTSVENTGVRATLAEEKTDEEKTAEEMTAAEQNGNAVEQETSEETEEASDEAPVADLNLDQLTVNFDSGTAVMECVGRLSANGETAEIRVHAAKADVAEPITETFRVGREYILAIRTPYLNGIELTMIADVSNMSDKTIEDCANGIMEQLIGAIFSGFCE